MPQRIVVPLDGSPLAERVLSHVARLLRREDAEVVLVRAVHVAPSLAKIDITKIEAAERRAAEAHLRDTAARLASLGVRVRSLVETGPPAESILDAARRERASLIAMSTHGRTGLARWALGSVAEKVVRASDVPVLLLHSFRRDADGRPVPIGDGQVPFRRILVPLDGSANALAVMDSVEATARLCGSEVLLLAVEPEGGEEAPGPAAAQAGAQAGRLKAAGIEASPLRLRGDPATRILDAAEAERADLIAMSTHGESGVSRWALGTVTERVLRSSTTPLLVVRCPQA
jgi:nucleotide-binding universal stress UspA family protein